MFQTAGKQMPAWDWVLLPNQNGNDSAEAPFSDWLVLGSRNGFFIQWGVLWGDADMMFQAAKQVGPCVLAPV